MFDRDRSGKLVCEMLGESLGARWLGARPELGQLLRLEYRCLSNWGRGWSMNDCVTAQWLL